MSDDVYCVTCDDEGCEDCAPLLAPFAWGYSPNQRRSSPRFILARDEKDAKRRIKQQMHLRRFSGSIVPADLNVKDANGRWLA